MRKVMIRSTIALLVLTIGVAQSAQATWFHPPKPYAFSKTLGRWMNAYWTWNLGGDQDGQIGRTVFMPVPDGAPLDPELCPTILVGETDVTLKFGERFLLPMFAFVGETYLEDEVPDDNPDEVPQELFTGATVILKVNGKVVLDSVVDDLNKFYFDATYFDEPIFYPEPSPRGEDVTAIGAIWVKGIGFMYPALPPGKHTMELFVDTGLDFTGPDDDPACTLQFINTWNITVERKRRRR